MLRKTINAAKELKINEGLKRSENFHKTAWGVINNTFRKINPTDNSIDHITFKNTSIRYPI